MTTSTHYQIFVYLFLLLVAACAPQNNTPITAQTGEVNYENEVAVPTVKLPPTNSKDAVKYQPLPQKIINISKSKAPVEIILGETELIDSKISYSSATGKMRLNGNVVITNERKEKLAEKNYTLNGSHETDKHLIVLHEDTSEKESIILSAQAYCLSELKLSDCNHVVIDVFILYNKKYYTQQIEINHKSEETPLPTPPSPEPAPTTIVQNEHEDHIFVQQPEDNDESINGRYQGSAETVDLNQLFPKEEPEKKEILKPQIKEKNLSPDFNQTRSDELRPINQAIGFPDKGRLQNATSVFTRQKALSKKAFFEVVTPDRRKHFSTYDMAEIITRGGDQLNKQYSKVLYVSNISAQNGGVLSAVINGKITRHVSHQNGLDADFAYPTDLSHLKFPLVVKMKTKEYFPNNYSIEKTYYTLKFFYLQQDIGVDRFFIDQKIKNDLCSYAQSKNEFSGPDKKAVAEMFENMQHVKGHGDHFHMRIKCSKSDPACRGRIYKKVKGCNLQ